MSLIPASLQRPDEELTPRSLFTKKAWAKMDEQLASAGILEDVLVDVHSEKPAWYHSVRRAYSRLRRMLKFEAREVKERCDRRERESAPPPRPTENYRGWLCHRGPTDMVSLATCARFCGPDGHGCQGWFDRLHL